jgi:hypothetical protein
MGARTHTHVLDVTSDDSWPEEAWRAGGGEHR